MKFRKLTQTYLSGKLSVTLVIPIKIARKYKIDQPCHVVVEEHPEGILIKKLDIKY